MGDKNHKISNTELNTHDSILSDQENDYEK